MKYLTLRTRVSWGAVALVLLMIAVLAVIAQTRGVPTLTNIVLSGLTLAALYFLVASGLSLIFGLMDVLNFAHGSIFMIGAYIGYTLFDRSGVLLTGLPLLLGLLADLFVAPLVKIPGFLKKRGIAVVSLVLAVVVALLSVREWESGASLARLLGGVLSGAFFGLSAAVGGERPRNQVSRPASAGVWAGPLVLLGLALLITWQQAPLSQAIIGLDSNWRFALALVIGTLSGGLLGALIEWSLIRPLYARPIFQVLMTLGLAFVLNEVVRALWGPAGFSMARPELFDQNCRAATLLDWAVNHCSRIDMLGRPFPTYRLFIIVVGLAIALIVALVLQRSRLGMIIRAGVQDAEMVQALGINVRQVFTLVFAAGAALAALGGVIAAPFLGVYTDMGLEFQLQGFIAVVIGGMGSYPGTALGAVVLGLARAIGDNVAGATIARASAVLIMTLILLVKPSGLLGKKE